MLHFASNRRYATGLLEILRLCLPRLLTTPMHNWPRAFQFCSCAQLQQITIGKGRQWLLLLSFSYNIALVSAANQRGGYVL